MIVVDGNHVRVDEMAVGIVSTRGADVHRLCGSMPDARRGNRDASPLDHLDLDDTGHSDGRLDRSVLMEDPIEEIVVVADHGRAANHEIAPRSAFAQVVLGMPPCGISKITLIVY